MGVVHPGDLNPNWRGGRSLTPHGYVLIRVGVDHHLADVRGYAYEHRLVAEEMLGRQLESTELVRHRKPPASNNDPSNLIICASRSHFMVHNRKSGRKLRLPDEGNPSVICKCGCGEVFDRYDKAGRPRLYVSGHNTAGRP